jgi:polysaccharide biosynthesis transport protein
MLDKNGKLSLDSVRQKADYSTKGLAMPPFCLASLRRSKRLLGIVAIAFLTVGLLYVALRPRTYTAFSEFLVYVKAVEGGPDPAILPERADLSSVQNQIQLIRSGNVLTAVVDSLRRRGNSGLYEGRFKSVWPGKASDLVQPARESSAALNAAVESLRNELIVRQVGASHVLSVSYQASDPETAARVVNTVIRVYLSELARVSDAGEAPALRELYQGLGPSAFVVSNALPPIKPDGPPAALIALGAALLGLCFAGAVVILRDLLRDTIRSAQEAEYALGMSCLGVVSTVADAPAKDTVEQGPRTLRPGQLRRLTASLLEASLSDRRIIGVTSAMPDEGASTIAIGLARAVAALGKRVLLVDGVSENCSVSHWAANSPRVAEFARTGLLPTAFDAFVGPEPGLHVLTRRMQSDADAHPLCPAVPDRGLEGAAGSYDMVIVDMPALASGPEVRAAAPSVDGVLLVVKWDATGSELVRQALRSAGEARPKFLGAILNMVDEQTMKLYGRRQRPEHTLAAAS